MQFADRIARLGTETAFAVSAEAAAFAAKGNKVYPFHLGDMNIPTPANVMDAAAKAMRDGKTGYCPNAGIPKLREVLAADVSASRGVPFTAENVAIQPGGKPTIGKFFLALMNPGDEVLYPSPGLPHLRVADRVSRRRAQTVPVPRGRAHLHDRSRPRCEARSRRARGFWS